MDFTLKKYKELLKVLIKNKYNFQTFDHFIRIPKNKTIVLRHDVDLMPENSLRFAKIQHEYGIKGVYYFRAVKESWDERIIKEIHEMGHEIGYHYENLTFCKGKYEQAIIDFEDGINLGWISEEFALEYLINLVKDQIDSKKYAQLAYKPQRLSYLRALAINSMIKDAVDTFIDNEQSILLGTFSQSLLEKSRFKPQIEDIIKISVENVYQSKEVIQKEVDKIRPDSLGSDTKAYRQATILYDKLKEAEQQAFKIYKIDPSFGKGR